MGATVQSGSTTSRTYSTCNFLMTVSPRQHMLSRNIYRVAMCTWQYSANSLGGHILYCTVRTHKYFTTLKFVSTAKLSAPHMLGYKATSPGLLELFVLLRTSATFLHHHDAASSAFMVDDCPRAVQSREQENNDVATSAVTEGRLSPPRLAFFIWVRAILLHATSLGSLHPLRRPHRYGARQLKVVRVSLGARVLYIHTTSELVTSVLSRVLAQTLPPPPSSPPLPLGDRAVSGRPRAGAVHQMGHPQGARTGPPCPTAQGLG